MKSTKSTGVNGKIDLTNLSQFELTSKAGNSQKEAKMRIFRHWEEINTRKRFNTQQQNNKTVNDDSHNSGDANTLSSDYGMKEAKGKAQQLLRERIHSRGADNGGGARAA